MLDKREKKREKAIKESHKFRDQWSWSNAGKVAVEAVKKVME